MTKKRNNFVDNINQFQQLYIRKEADNDLDAFGLPKNLQTHEDAWRKAILLCHANDFGNREYWEHELKAYDYTMRQLQQIRTNGKYK